MNSPLNLVQARKHAVIYGLAGIASIHLMDLPGKFAETPYLAVAYLGMIGASLLLIERLIKRATRADFMAAGVLAASVLLGFIVNRTVGMPGAMGDIGNWFEPLGFLSMFVEAFTIYQTIAAVKDMSKIQDLPQEAEHSQSYLSQREVLVQS